LNGGFFFFIYYLLLFIIIIFLFMYLFFYCRERSNPHNVTTPHQACSLFGGKCICAPTTPGNFGCKTSHSHIELDNLRHIHHNAIHSYSFSHWFLFSFKHTHVICFYLAQNALHAVCDHHDNNQRKPDRAHNPLQPPQGHRLHLLLRLVHFHLFPLAVR